MTVARVVTIIALATQAAAATAQQTQQGVIAGRVTDSTLSPLPGVTVTATASGAQGTALTGADGRYTISNLPAGSDRTYSLKLELTGFKSLLESAVVLESPRFLLTVDAVLQVGSCPDCDDGIFINTIEGDGRRGANDRGEITAGSGRRPSLRVDAGSLTDTASIVDVVKMPADVPRNLTTIQVELGWQPGTAPPEPGHELLVFLKAEQGPRLVGDTYVRVFQAHIVFWEDPSAGIRSNSWVSDVANRLRELLRQPN
jgi:hypothetical protein